jgi:hypothetical protein
MLHTITHVTPLPGHKLSLTFDTQEKKVFDMSPYLNIGIFRELKDEKNFAQVKISW